MSAVVAKPASTSGRPSVSVPVVPAMPVVWITKPSAFAPVSCSIGEKTAGVAIAFEMPTPMMPLIPYA